MSIAMKSREPRSEEFGFRRGRGAEAAPAFDMLGMARNVMGDMGKMWSDAPAAAPAAAAPSDTISADQILAAEAPSYNCWTGRNSTDPPAAPAATAPGQTISADEIAAAEAPSYNCWTGRNRDDDLY